MRATGIVRRIDDLGRIVIPKEIRRTLRIRESEPMEIYTGSQGEVIFKKYSPIGEVSVCAGDYAEVLNRTAGVRVLICDRDRVVACAGAPRRDWLDVTVPPALEQVMEGRRLYRPTPGQPLFCESLTGSRCAVRVAAPILVRGDVTGCVLFLAAADAADLPEETECKLAGVAAALLGKQLDPE